VAYVWLGAAGLALAGWEIFSRRSSVALAVYWVAAAMVFTADYAVLDLMEMYHYRPGLVPGLMPDTVLGVFLAELGFAAGWAVWVVHRMPPWLGTVAGTAVVLVLETRFRHLGIFRGYSWTLWHTAAAFPPYFLLVYWFRSKAETYGVAGGWVRAAVRVSIALFWSHFVAMVAYWITIGVIMNVHELPTFARNQTLGAILTLGAFVNPAIYWVMVARGRTRLLRLGWSTAALLLIGQFWVAAGVWQFRAPWNLYVHTAVLTATIYIAAVCDDWVGRWAEAREGTVGEPVRSD